MRRVVMAIAAQQLLRADALLREELARLNDARSAMTPVAKATISTVLSALGEDPDLNPDIAAEARRVLGALLERPEPQQSRHPLDVPAIRLRAA